MRELASCIIALGVLLAAAGCAPSAPRVSPAPPQADGAQTAASGSDRASRLKALYEAAKNEGEVIWQVGSTVEEMQPFAEAFQREYPGIKVSLVSVAAPQMASRIATEAAAGRLTTDLNWGSIGGDLFAIQERRLLNQVKWDELVEIDSGRVGLEGAHLTMYQNVHAWMYNTSLVSPDKVPRKWEDLLDPMWKGKIVLVRGTTGLTSLYFEWGEDRAREYLTRLKTQAPIVVRIPREVRPRVVSGEGLIGITFLGTAMDTKAAGAPVDIAPVGPVVAISSGVYLVKGVPHPNAAKLLAAWTTSPSAQKIWAETGRGMAEPCSASRDAQVLCEKGLKVIPFNTLEKATLREKYDQDSETVLGFTPR